jgi:uncharacterized OB-fold protein
MEWHEMKGKGKLATFTSIYIGPPWMIAQGYDRTHPYASAVVDLEEGTRIDARLIGVDADKPDTIKIGMPLTVGYRLLLLNHVSSTLSSVVKLF